MFSDQQTIYQGMKDMEEQPRVRRYIISARQLIGLFTSRRTDKDCLEITECALPEGYRIRAMTTMSCPAGLIVYVEHPSFDPVPLGQDPPTFQQRYELVTLRKIDQEVPPHDAYVVVDRQPLINDKKEGTSCQESTSGKRCYFRERNNDCLETIKDFYYPTNQSSQTVKPIITKDKIAAALRRLGVCTIGSRSDLARWSVTDLATDLEAELNKPE